MRHAAERVGGGRHDCEQVGLFREGDVQDAAGIRREEVDVCRPLRHAGERERRDETRGIFGKDSGDLCLCLGKLTGERHRLERGYAPANPKQDSLST